MIKTKTYTKSTKHDLIQKKKSSLQLISDLGYWFNYFLLIKR